jgi:hypothetical protein
MAASKTFICYHYPCPDGIAACLATFIGLTKDVHVTTGVAAAASASNIVFCPMEIYKPESTRVSLARERFNLADTVYIVDFSGGVEFIQTACSRAGRVILLDHHKTAKEELSTLTDPPANLELHFDMLRSGAGIARDYFNISTDAAYVEKFGAPAVERLNRFFALIEDVSCISFIISAVLCNDFMMVSCCSAIFGGTLLRVLKTSALVWPA